MDGRFRDNIIILGAHKYLVTHVQKKYAKPAEKNPARYLVKLGADKPPFLKKCIFVALDEVEVEI